MSGDIDGHQPARPMINPDPYPSGIYSVLSYPSVTDAAVAASGAAATSGLPLTDHHAAGEALARIGDIEVTATAVRTPAGQIPLAGVSVEVIDERVVRTPTWAVLCAIIGFFVVPVVSLLFLLVRETAAVGPTRVRVTGGGVRHETLVADAAEVELARSLAAS
jgi:hypothetical protein